MTGEIHPRPECVDNIRGAIKTAVLEVTSAHDKAVTECHNAINRLSESLNVYIVTSDSATKQMADLVRSNQAMLHRLDQIVVNNGDENGHAAMIRENRRQINEWRDGMSFLKRTVYGGLALIISGIAYTSVVLYRIEEHMADKQIHVHPIGEIVCNDKPQS